MTAADPRPDVALDVLVSTPRRSRGRRRTTVVATVASMALVVAAATFAARAGADAPPRYRTIAAGRHDVEQTLTAVATVEPVSEASVAFPVGGTVASVDVAVGQQVVVGQQLASLDTSSLLEQLHARQASLAQAQLALQQGLVAAADAAKAKAAAAAAAATTTTTAPARPAGGSGRGADGQHAVVTAQAAVDAALAAADQASSAADQVCATVTDAATASACGQAQRAVATAQRTAAGALASLSTAASAWDAQLATTSTAATSGAGGSHATAPSPTASTTRSSGASAGAAAGGSSTAAPSSAELVALQQAIDAARWQVAVALQSLAQATIVSPIAGTVVDVQLAVGDAVSAASTTARVRVAGDGGVEATTTVSVDHLADLAVGQRAVVVPDGSDEHLAASVVSVGTVPVSTGSTAYRVVLALADPTTPGLGDGATATATITTAATASALAVPTSAVATTGTRHTVTVLDGGTTRTVQVGVGAVGATWTQITSGLDAGERVVLADLDAALPGSATASPSSTTGAGAFAERAALRAAGVGGSPGGFGGRGATGGR